jgi:hypothetical protein
MALGLAAWWRQRPRRARRAGVAGALAAAALAAWALGPGAAHPGSAPAAGPGDPARAAGPAPAPHGDARAARAAGARGGSPARPPLDAAQAAAAATAAARARADACERQLAAAEAALDAAQAALLPPAERWAAAPPAPARTALLRAPVSAALAPLPAVAAPQLECRGELCQIQLHAPSRAASQAALRALAADPDLRALSIGFVSEPGVPIAGAGSGRGGYAVTAYVVTTDDAVATADAAAPLRAVLAEVHRGGAVARCAAAGPERGTLEVELTATALAPPALAIGGSLAGTAVGRCLGAAVASALEAARLPPTAAGAVAASLESPHGP